MPLINFSGLASGIDSEALIEATTEAERARRITPNEDKIAEIEDENSAIDELETLLRELKDMMFSHTSVNGGIVAKSAVSADDTVISAVASDSASSGTYSITVNALAKNHTYSYPGATDTFNNGGDAIDGSIVGTTSVAWTIGSTNVSIDLDSTTTYNDLVTEFNTQANGVATASFVKVSDPGVEPAEYAFVINSNKVGIADGFITQTSDPAGTTKLQSANSTEDAATNSSVTIGGIGTIVRSSNTINDIVPGVTLNLASVNASAVTVTVAVDADETESRIQDFVDKYNEIVVLIEENNRITREEDGEEVTNIFGPLAKTSLDEGILQQLRSAFSGTSNDSGTVRVFADMGIVTNRDGTLSFNTTSADNPNFNFASAIVSDPERLNALFESFSDEIAVTGGVIDQYTRFNGLIDNTVNSNNEQISDLNDRIQRAEESIARTEQTLRARFARLESLVSRLQNEQNALTSAIASLGTG